MRGYEEMEANKRKEKIVKVKESINEVKMRKTKDKVIIFSVSR